MKSVRAAVVALAIFGGCAGHLVPPVLRTTPTFGYAGGHGRALILRSSLDAGGRPSVPPGDIDPPEEAYDHEKDPYVRAALGPLGSLTREQLGLRYTADGDVILPVPARLEPIDLRDTLTVLERGSFEPDEADALSEMAAGKT